VARTSPPKAPGAGSSRHPKFRQSNLSGALKAARKAGFEPDEVIVAPDGAIRLLARSKGVGGAPDDVADEIDRWARGQQK
jgi:hypothetical protein